MIEKLNEFIKKHPFCIVQISADWCAHCEPMEKLIGNIANQKNIPILKLEAGEEIRDIVNQYYVASLPTFLIFREGHLENRIVGTQSQDKIKHLLG